MPVSTTEPPAITRHKTARRQTPKLAERREAVDGVFQLAGFGCIMFRQYADAGAIGMHSPPVAEELIALSDKNEKIGKALDYLTEAGPYAGLIIAVMPLVLQLAANHGLVKTEYLGSSGVVPPAALESQVRADMARQAAEALRAQQTAEKELAALAHEMSDQTEPETVSEPSNGRRRARKPQETPAG